MIRTVLGDVEKEGLGFVLPHEHLFARSKKIVEDYPALLIDDVSKTLVDVREFKASGGGSIVDCQPAFCGRDAEKLAEISKQSGVNIVASTGFHSPSFYDGVAISLLSEKSEAEITDFFVSEIAIGTVKNDAEDFDEERLPCKAGMIKTALVSPDESMEKKLFSAGAAASKETGAPLMIHTEMANAKKELLGLLSFLTGMGVCENKIIFAHLDRTKGDLGVHKELAGEGCLLDYDTVMRHKYHSDEKEIEIISEMLGAGFEDNILLSLDTTRERLRGYGGVPGLAGMQNHFVPKLKAAGITQEILDKIFVQNAAKVLDMADYFEGRKP